MLEQVAPKERIKNIPHLRNDKIEENWETIGLFWTDTLNNYIELIFGKRSVLYYKCPPAQFCMCYMDSTRIIDITPKIPKRAFDLKAIELNKQAESLLSEKGWKGLFNFKKFPTKGGETVVVEEAINNISFYFDLENKDKADISFTIHNDERVRCTAKRVCAKETRVTYTTYRGFIPKKASPLFSKH